MLPYLYIVLLVVFIFFVIHNMERRIGGIKFLIIIASLFLNILSLIILDILTLENNRGGMSGNGNPAILVYPFFLPLLLIFLCTWVAIVYKDFALKSLSMVNKYLLAGLSLLIVGLIFGETFMNNALKPLENTPYHPFKGEYGSVINIYTNAIFFNGITFGVLVLALFVGILLWVKMLVLARNTKVRNKNV
ncbi:hypothetical protein AMD00_00050 [Viridibacillus arvi]|uniref:Uncharacterized protein n=2 Tax=Viridibacillus arvi TaxID=263475 RepID=A0A0M0LJV3_9BACL|nr:hypothetical protein AMD00_00050 [Viridibacillus arvi]